MVPISTIVHESAQQCFEYDVNPASTDSAYSQLNEALHNIKRGIDPEQWGWVEELKAASVKPDLSRMMGGKNCSLKDITRGTNDRDAHSDSGSS